MNENNRYLTKVYTIVAMIFIVLTFLFGDGIIWKLNPNLKPTHDNVEETVEPDNSDIIQSNKEDNVTEEDTTDNLVQSTDDNEYDNLPKNPHFTMIDDNCYSEAHGYVKTVEDLNGVITRNKEDEVSFYLNRETGDYDLFDIDEQLHHIYFDFSKYSFDGMQVVVYSKGSNHGTVVEKSIKNDQVELYISEGEFRVLIEKWEEDYTTVPYLSVDVTIDHCGTYTLQ